MSGRFLGFIRFGDLPGGQFGHQCCVSQILLWSQMVSDNKQSTKSMRFVITLFTYLINYYLH